MPPPKECPPGKIVNPATGRCVKTDGKIGKNLAAAAAPAPKKKVTPKKKKDDKQAILEKIKTMCNNDYDPISMDYFSDMTVEQLKSLVFIGSESKKNCYFLDNIYELYKNAVIEKKQAKDPMNPKYILTKAEIKDINAKMKMRDPTYSPPKLLRKKYLKKYFLSIETSEQYPDYYSIEVITRLDNEVQFDLGIVPAWITINDTQNDQYTSAVLINNLKTIWEKNKFMNSVTKCCNITLRKKFNYWKKDPIPKFIELCDQVNSQLH